MIARFHGGYIDGEMITEWSDPPGPSVWAERVRGGLVITYEPDSEYQLPADRSPGSDRYALAEIIADLAIYYVAES